MNLPLKRFVALAAGTAIGAALLVGSAGAQQPSEDAVRKAFADADVNRDGYLNMDEYIANVIYVFRDADKNRDGFHVEQESMAYSPMHSPARVKAADGNGDGTLPVGEAVAVKLNDFSDIDTNRDGVIS